MADAKDEGRIGQGAAELTAEQLGKVAGGDKCREKDWNACCSECHKPLRTRNELVNSVYVQRYYCNNGYCSMYNKSLLDSEIEWQKVD